MVRHAIIASIGFLLCACDYEMFERPKPPGDISLAKLNARSDFFRVSATARNLKFGTYGGMQGSQEFLYFEDSRENADQFAKELIGSTPDDDAYEFNAQPWEEADAPWSPTQALHSSRGGGVLNDGMGRREVVIIDHESYSQVWAFRAYPA